MASFVLSLFPQDGIWDVIESVSEGFLTYFRISPMIQKNPKIFTLHYANVRGDVLRPPRGTTLAAVKIQ